jgi:acetyl-CoA C-acetyltransferase
VASALVKADPRTPCIIGVAHTTWHPAEVGEQGAPEPLAMWEHVARAAAADAGQPRVLTDLDAIEIVYCQTWQYDDAPRRLADRLDVAPKRLHYSGIGGTTGQQLVDATAERMLRGELDLVLVTSAEALATQRAYKKRGARAAYSFEPEERRPFPWESPPDPIEIAHEVFQAWLTFAVFENARRAHLGIDLDAYRLGLGQMLHPMTRVAAANPDAWFPIERSVDELVAVRPENRMVGYPYTKYMVAVMDVDMAAALVIATHAKADALGVPPDQRVYLRGWGDGRDPVLVAARPEMWRSPALAAAADTALRTARVAIDDVAHLDLYSCFGSSLHFACDALGIDPLDTRGLTVTGGLPYHGGPGSGYLVHAIAKLAESLRADPGAYGLVSGVGMHMTKHGFGVYSTTPGPLQPSRRPAQRRPSPSRPSTSARRRLPRIQSCTAATVRRRGRCSSVTSTTAPPAPMPASTLPISRRRARRRSWSGPQCGSRRRRLPDRWARPASTWRPGEISRRGLDRPR